MLQLELDLSPSLVRGEFPIGIVRVVNRSQAPARVRARLNLFEGDLRLSVSTPDGTIRQAHGIYQPDTGLRLAELGPDQRLESGVDAFFTSIGFTFDQVGDYQVAAEYDATAGSPPLRSEPVSVTVREPSDEEGKSITALTLHEDVGRGVALADPDAGSETRRRLEQIAAGYPGRKEGKIASLILGAAAAGKRSSAGPTADHGLRESIERIDKVFSETALLTVAHWISALATPVSPYGQQLQESLVGFVEKERADTASAASADRVIAIALGKPVG